MPSPGPVSSVDPNAAWWVELDQAPCPSCHTAPPEAAPRPKAEALQLDRVEASRPGSSAPASLASNLLSDLEQQRTAEASAAAVVQASLTEAADATDPLRRRAAAERALAGAQATGDVEAAKAALDHLEAASKALQDPVGARYATAERALLEGRLEDAARGFAALAAATREVPEAQRVLEERLAQVAELQAATAETPAAALDAMKQALARAPTAARAQAAVAAYERAHGSIAQAQARVADLDAQLAATRQEILQLKAPSSCGGHHRAGKVVDTREAVAAAEARAARIEGARDEATSALAGHRDEVARLFRAGVAEAPTASGRLWGELALADHLAAGGDTAGARGVLGAASEALGRVPGDTEVRRAQLAVAAQQASLALVDGDVAVRREARARLAEARRGLIGSAQEGLRSESSAFLVLQADFLTMELDLTEARTPAERASLARTLGGRIRAEGDVRSTARGALVERMTLRVAQLEAEAPGGRDGALYRLRELTRSRDPDLAAQASLQTGLLLIEAGRIEEGLGYIASMQLEHPRSSAAKAASTLPGLEEARDASGRVHVRRDGSEAAEALKVAFVRSGQGPAWRTAALATLGFVVAGPAGAAGGLALDRAIGVAESWDEVQGAFRTGVSAISRAQLAQEVLLSGAEVLTLAAAGAVGRVARSAGRWGMARLVAEGARFAPRLEGAGVLVRGAQAAAGFAAEGAAIHGAMAAQQAVLTGRPFHFDPVAALQMGLVTAAGAAARRGALGGALARPGTRLAQVEPWAKETVLGFGADYLSREGLSALGAEGWDPGTLAEHADAQLRGLGALFLGGALAGSIRPAAQASAALEARAARWMAVAEARLPPPGSGSGPGLAWATSGAAGLRARALFGAPRPAAEHVFLSESRTTELVWEQGEGQVPTEAGANLSVLTEKPLGKAALSKLADHVARHHGEVEIMVVEPESVATLRRLDDGALVTDSPAVKAALGDRVRVHARATDMQGVLRALEGGAELVELTGAPDAADLAGLFEGHGKVELRWSDGARTGKLAVGANGKAQLTAPPELAAGLTERLLWAERPFRLAVEGQGTVSSVPTQTRLRGSLATIAPILEVVCTHRALAGRVAGPDAPIARLMKGSLHSAMDHVRKATVGDIPEAWKASSEPWLEAAEGMARFQANDRAGNLAHALEAIEARSELPDTVVAQGLAGQAKGWNSVALVRLFGEGTAATQRRILQDLRDNFSPTGRVALRGAFLDVVWRADKQDAGLSAAHEKRVLGSLLTRANDRLTASSVVAIPADRTGSNARTKTPDFLVQEFGAGDSVEVSRWTEAKSWHWPYLGNRAQELATGIAQLQGHKLRSPGTNTFELSIDLYGTSATVATKERAVRALAPSAFAPHGNISLVVW